jgi:uncharacterized membrane protein
MMGFWFHIHSCSSPWPRVYNLLLPVIFSCYVTGGSVTAGMGIYDAMMLCRADVQTYCFGLAASMGAFLLGAGTCHVVIPHQIKHSIKLSQRHWADEQHLTFGASHNQQPVTANQPMPLFVVVVQL